MYSQVCPICMKSFEGTKNFQKHWSLKHAPSEEEKRLSKEKFDKMNQELQSSYLFHLAEQKSCDARKVNPRGVFKNADGAFHFPAISPESNLS